MTDPTEVEGGACDICGSRQPAPEKPERGLEAAYKRHKAGGYMMPSGNIVPTGPTNPAWSRR